MRMLIARSFDSKPNAFLLVLCVITFAAHAFAECIVSNPYKSNAAIVSLQAVGQSFTACETGDLESISVLSSTTQSGVTISVYYGDGLSGHLLGVLHDVTLKAREHNEDWSVINISELDLPMFRDASYTFSFSPVSLVYRTSNGYQDGQMYVETVAQNTDLFFQAEIIGAQALSSELTGFCAAFENHSIVLQWHTANESNLAGFMIDRAGKDLNWKRIASFQTHKELVAKGLFTFNNIYTFTDEHIDPGKLYNYRLCDMSHTGNETRHQPISISTLENPYKTGLVNAHPNPFNPRITIHYQIEKDGYATVQVFDLLGHLIKTLNRQFVEPGSYQVEWNGKMKNGLPAPSGTYIILMQVEKETYAKKVLLMR